MVWERISGRCVSQGRGNLFKLRTGVGRADGGSRPAYCHIKHKSPTGCGGFAFKWWAVQDLPSGKTPDGVFLQAGLVVFALWRSPQTKTSLRLSNPGGRKAVCVLTAADIKHKSPTAVEDLRLNGGQYRI